ncbi:sensor histidine kinase [Flavobacterium sp. RHBU_24]|uniref:sensor histidine kinase n=1 Tax=Flavobacterium sp. RHBU_24 TaxID=3391185 RepID=UPI003985434C
MLLFLLQVPAYALAILITLTLISVLAVTIIRLKKQIQALSINIERYKLEKTFKENELNAVDNLILVQEQERVAITRELHDSLGSMLSTLKHNFENLKIRRNIPEDDLNKIFDRTDSIIDEAYYNVRRLASDKSTGTLPGNSLIPALKNLTGKLSATESVNFQVLSYGFEERINNSLEITIFRMVQELATNIVKHSNATEATIQLTNHGHTVNIIVEDNGKGFMPKKACACGTGLTMLKQKVMLLNGTFEIDSTPNKGTTIVIELPL